MIQIAKAVSKQKVLAEVMAELHVFANTTESKDAKVEEPRKATLTRKDPKTRAMPKGYVFSAVYNVSLNSGSLSSL